MKQQTFEQQHANQWEQFSHYLDQLEQKKTSSSQFPQLYRQICHHLALARDRHYSPYLIERLNHLVLRGHQQMYTQREHHFLVSLLQFFMTDFPQAVRREWRFVSLSAVLFFAPLFITAIITYLYPEVIYSLLSFEQAAEMEAMYDPQYDRIGRNRDADSDFLMFGYYIYNNTSIGFQVFAGGMLFGLGSLFFIIFNGLYIGAVAGHLVQLGFHTPFFSFVSGHSGLELMAIVISGGAGLKLGFALIAPQRLYRSQALIQAAKESMALIYGIIVMFFLAAFVEAFWSSTTSIDPIIKYIVGISLWVLILSYFSLMGRNRAIR
ncbi:stage II sporulation protein M [Candidatus Albibeggiatoa sp. nov. NOAA]|uniref:stage II sporulation protein M n=1 Tax=Candidatus Albibeggiatoa sp. nov. NOAA TaxID=3162724 RepID=UPI0032F7D1AA|nr:stage II sporulation protein M [Thiotrichaceae bacterium]